MSGIAGASSTGDIPDPARAPTDNVDGGYINYCDSDLNDYGLETALRLYYGGNLERLKKQIGSGMRGIISRTSSRFR